MSNPFRTLSLRKRLSRATWGATVVLCLILLAFALR